MEDYFWPGNHNWPINLENQNPWLIFFFMVHKWFNIYYFGITNEGIGYTFNNANFWDIFARTNYTKLFAKIMRFLS